MTVYERIKKRRIELGMSQQQLADKVGYKSRSAINKIEMGLRDINESKIMAFAQALNVTPSYLMGWDDEKKTITYDETLNLLYSTLVKEGIIGAGEDLTEEQYKISINLLRAYFDAKNKETD